MTQHGLGPKYFFISSHTMTPSTFKAPATLTFFIIFKQTSTLSSQDFIPAALFLKSVPHNHLAPILS